jgi:hypothetical protein
MNEQLRRVAGRRTIEVTAGEGIGRGVASGTWLALRQREDIARRAAKSCQAAVFYYLV